MTSGTILKNQYGFTGETDVIDVLNDDGTIILYGEVDALINPATGKKYGKGDRIEQGDEFSTVMVNKYGRSMLHVEVYSGELYSKAMDKNPDTDFGFKDTSNQSYYYVPNKSYQRNSDILDPTGILDLPYYK